MILTHKPGPGMEITKARNAVATNHIVIYKNPSKVVVDPDFVDIVSRIERTNKIMLLVIMIKSSFSSILALRVVFKPMTHNA